MVELAFVTKMAGTDHKQELLLLTEGPSAILVDPQSGDDIGMAARAMANFGLIGLRILSQTQRQKAQRRVPPIYPTLRDAMDDLSSRKC